MKVSEIKNMVWEALLAENERVASLEPSADNPTVKPLYDKAVASVATLSAVLDAINGNPVQLKILGGK